MSHAITRRWRRLAAHHRVRVTIIFSLLYVAFSEPTATGLVVGASLVAAGQAVRFWAAGYLEKNVTLARVGPYAIVRHPLYAGSFLMGLGLAVSVAGAAWWTLAYLALYTGFFLPAIHVEELRLQSIFGAEYQDLMVDVPRLRPRLSTTRVSAENQPAASFSWRRILTNREQRSAAAMAALLGLQGLKLWLG